MVEQRRGERRHGGSRADTQVGLRVFCGVMRARGLLFCVRVLSRPRHSKRTCGHEQQARPLGGVRGAELESAALLDALCTAMI